MGAWVPGHTMIPRFKSHSQSACLFGTTGAKWRSCNLEKIASVITICTRTDAQACIANELRTEPELYQNSAGSFLITSLFCLQVGLGVAGRILESRFGKPSLVRETSRVSYRHPWRILSREFNRWRDPPNSKKIMNGLILHPELGDKLGYLTKATQNTAAHNAPYRNILLHGTPGASTSFRALFQYGIVCDRCPGIDSQAFG